MKFLYAYPVRVMNITKRNDSRQLDLPKREEGVLKFWEDHDTFQKTLLKTKGGKPFVFYEGPPTANGSPGIHHFEARAFKDCIPRYKTMRGFYVERKAGWDTHGLPVEIQVEKELGLKSKKEIEQYGIGKFNAKCRESVWRYKEEWDRFTKRIGFWLDLEHPYITYETPYIESLWWAIKEFSKKKLLYRDFKVVPWCTRCETALSTHELGLGYKAVKDRSVWIRFRVKSDEKRWANTSILSWTTTPWTLPGNVALAINPDEDYVCIPDPEAKKQWVIMGQKRFRAMVEESKFPPEYRSSLMLDDIDTFKGKEIVGLRYEPLFPVRELASDASHRVYAADFVTMEEGSGVVHTAVMYGDDDYRLGKKVGLPTFHTVDETGRFIRTLGGGLAGLPVKDAETEEKIIQSLREGGLLFREEQYEHEYPFCWRCEMPLLYYAREAWWVKVSSLRNDLVRNNEEINWVPEHIKQGRFGEFLKEARDWAFSRERFWGTPLPVWVCEKCKHHEVIGSLEELSEHAGPSENTYLVLRHGESEAMMLGIVSSEHDSYPLTEKGKKEIENAAKKLKDKKIDLIFSSPILRAKESAEISGRALGIEAKIADELSETNFGILSGKPVAGYHQLCSAPIDYFTKAPMGGENLNDVKRRVARLMRRLEKEYEGKTILLVSHNDPIWLLSGIGQGLNNEEIVDRHPRHTMFVEPAGFRDVTWLNLPRDETGDVNLHRPFVDELELECPRCRGAMRRVPEVCDVWFDSGGMPFAQYHFPFAFDEGKETRNRKQETALPFPADYICEAIDQTRGWFYTLLAVATALGREAPYKNVISLGHVLDKEGQKMSKSKGNIVDPEDMIGKYGADAIRWYFFTINGPGDPKRFDEKDLILKLRGPLATLWNSFVLFDTYVEKIINYKFIIHNSRSVLDQWAMARLDELTRGVTDRLDAYDIVGAARLIETFIADDFSNWYLRRSRRRFQKPESGKEKDEAAAVTAHALLTLAELMAPFTPFLAEAVYQELKKKLGLQEESVHLREWPRAQGTKNKKQKTGLREAMAEVRRIAAFALSERAKVGIRVRQPLGKLKVRSLKFKVPDEVLELLKDEVNVKQIVVDPKQKSEIELDATVTPELRREGLLRELIRNIQEMRRDAGFRPVEKIHVQVDGDAALTALIGSARAFLEREVGAGDVSVGGKRKVLAERDVTLDGASLWIGIRKA